MRLAYGNYGMPVTPWPEMVRLFAGIGRLLRGDGHLGLRLTLLGGRDDRDRHLVRPLLAVDHACKRLQNTTAHQD